MLSGCSAPSVERNGSQSDAGHSPGSDGGGQCDIGYMVRLESPRKTVGGQGILTWLHAIRFRTSHRQGLLPLGESALRMFRSI